MSPAVSAVLADAILVFHVAIVAFVVLGTAAILAGGPWGWRWIRGRRFRIAHLALMVFIALQAWLGRLCPLTEWEQALRVRAGQDAYAGSFVEHWLSRLIYFDVPWWAFVAGYTLLAFVLAACWWLWPPVHAGDQAAVRRMTAKRGCFFALSYWRGALHVLHSGCRSIGQTTPPSTTEQETWRRKQ